MGKHISFDLETLDVTASSVVCALGACFFDDERIYANFQPEVVAGGAIHEGAEVPREPWAFYATFQWQPQFEMGRTVSESTLRWWLGEGGKVTQAARDALLEGKPLHPVTALQELSAWADRWGAYADEDRAVWWANGPSFDSAIIESMARGLKIPAPWRYNEPRDLRTMRDFMSPEELKALVPPDNVAHNALKDAIYQARILQAAFTKMHLRISQVADADAESRMALRRLGEITVGADVGRLSLSAPSTEQAAIRAAADQNGQE